MLRDARDVAKAESWGSSDRSETVRRFTCQNCKNSWIVEDG